MRSTQHSKKSLSILMEIAKNPGVEQGELPDLIDASYKTMLHHLKPLRNNMLVEKIELMNEKNVNKFSYRITLAGLLILLINEQKTMDHYDTILEKNGYQFPIGLRGINSKIFEKWSIFKEVLIPESDFFSTDFREHFPTLADFLKDILPDQLRTLKTPEIIDEEFSPDLVLFNNIFFNSYLSKDFIELSIAQASANLDEPNISEADDIDKILYEAFTSDKDFTDLMDDYIQLCKNYIRSQELKLKSWDNAWKIARQKANK